MPYGQQMTLAGPVRASNRGFQAHVAASLSMLRRLRFAGVAALMVLAGCSGPTTRAPIVDGVGTSSTPTPAARGSYVVKPGDTLYAIARSTNVDFETIKRLNNLSDPNQLVVGQVSDLVTYRLANQKTIRAVREGALQTRHGVFSVTAYQDTTHERLHLALTRGVIDAAKPTLVRVHVTAVFRDLVGTTLDGYASWSFDASLKEIAESESGVLVLLSKPEATDDLLHDIDRLLGEPVSEQASSPDAYNQIGMGAKILRDLGVGQISLLGAPLKYNALAGFGLEVVDFVTPPEEPQHH